MRVSSFVEITKKLNRCEQCCFRQTKNYTKNKTYDLVRRKFVDIYWNTRQSDRIY